MSLFEKKKKELQSNTPTPAPTETLFQKKKNELSKQVTAPTIKADVQTQKQPLKTQTPKIEVAKSEPIEKRALPSFAQLANQTNPFNKDYPVRKEIKPEIKAVDDTKSKWNLSLIPYLTESTKKKLDEGKPFEQKINVPDNVKRRTETARKAISQVSGEKLSDDLFSDISKLTPEQRKNREFQRQLYDYYSSWWKINDKKTRDNLIKEVNEAQKKQDDFFRYGLGKQPAKWKQDLEAGLGAGLSFGLTNLDPARSEEGVRLREQDGMFSVYNLAKMGGSIVPIGTSMNPIASGLRKAMPKTFAQKATDTAKEKAMKRLKTELTADTIAGAGYDTTSEILDAKYDTRKDGDQNALQRIANVGTGALFGLGIGGAIEGLPFAARAAKNAYTTRRDKKRIDAWLNTVRDENDEDIKLLKDTEQNMAVDLAQKEKAYKIQVAKADEMDMDSPEIKGYEDSNGEVVFLTKEANDARIQYEEALDRYDETIRFIDAINNRASETIFKGTDRTLVLKTDLDSLRDMLDDTPTPASRMDESTEVEVPREDSTSEPTPATTVIPSEPKPPITSPEPDTAGIPVTTAEPMPATPKMSETDELYDTAVETVRTNNRASVDFIQRQLGVTKTRAQRILEQLERNGVVVRNERNQRVVAQEPKEVETPATSTATAEEVPVTPDVAETPVPTTTPNDQQLIDRLDELLKKNETEGLSPQEQSFIDTELGATTFTKKTPQKFYIIKRRYGAKENEKGVFEEVKGVPVDLGNGVSSFIHVEKLKDGVRRIIISEAKSGFRITYIDIKSGKVVDAYNRLVNKAKLYIRKAIAEKNDANTFQKAIDDSIKIHGTSPKYADATTTAPIDGLPKKDADATPTTEPDDSAYFGDSTGAVAGSMPTYAPTGRTISRGQLIQNLRDRFNITIATGLYKKLYKKALGVFITRREVIRTKIADDMYVIAHELGHFLDKKFKLQDAAWKDEMLKFWDKVYPGGRSSYEPHQYYDEAVAEFIRVYLIDPAYAKTNAPNFYAHFEKMIDKATLKKLSDTHEDIKTWIGQGAYEQGMGMIDYLRVTNKRKSTLKRAYIKVMDRIYAINTTGQEALEAIETEWQDITKKRPDLKKAIEDMDATKKELDTLLKKKSKKAGDKARVQLLLEAIEFHNKRVAAQNIYISSRLTYGSQGKAESILNYGFMDDMGEIKAEGLQGILNDLDKIGADYTQFDAYCAAYHARYLRDTLGKQIPFNDTELKEFLDLARKFPQFESMRKRLVKFNQNLLDMLVEGGIVKKSVAKELKEKYPHYVPFFRVMDDDYTYDNRYGGKSMGGSGESFVDLANPLRKMSEEGSTRAIISPLESIITQVHYYVSQIDKNKVGQQLWDLGAVEGIGNVIERLDKGVYYQIRNKSKKRAEHVVEVWRNGEKHQIKVHDQELFDALLGLDETQSNWLLRIFNKATTILKFGATGTPEFVVRNPFRDMLTAWVLAGLTPIRTLKGLKSVITKDKRYQQFLYYGGRTSFDFSVTNRETAQATLKEMTDKQRSVYNRLIGKDKQGKDFALHVLGMLSFVKPFYRTLQGLHTFSEYSDQIIRVGIFEEEYLKTGDFQKAAFEARDIIDFNRAGAIGYDYNKVAAFFNASLQGTDAIFRYAAKHKWKFMLRGLLYLTLPTMALQMYNLASMDEEAKKEYSQIDRWQKDLFFIIYNPVNRNFIRLPKPYGLSFFFINPVERAGEYLYFGEKDAMTKDLWDSFVRNFVPPYLPQLFTPIYEYATGYNLFKKYDTVPADEAILERKDQFDMNTSLTSRAISQGLDKIGVEDDTPIIGGFKSPRLTDQFIYGYTAGAGRYATDLIDQGLKLTGMFDKDVSEPAKRFTELPVARAFFVNTSQTAKQTKEFYDLYSKVNEEKNSNRRNMEQNKVDKDAKRPFDRLPAQTRFEVLNKFKKPIDELNAYSNYIRKREDLNSQDKREKLDEIRKQIESLAERALKQAGR